MATKDFDWLGQTTDKLRDNLQAKPRTDVELTISNWLKKRIEVAKEGLEEDDRNGTGALGTSIRPSDLITNQEEVIVNILAEDYWDFINSGVNGVQNNFGAPYSFKNLGVGQGMKQAFKEFIQVRGIQPRDPEMSYDSLAYVLAKSVKKKGIKATPYMDEAFSPEAISDLAKQLGKTVKRIFE